MKLTPRQNDVINCLQKGWVLITDSEIAGALVCNDEYEYKISNRLFFNLVDKGLIYQGGAEEHFGYLLTQLGTEIKTNDVEI